MPYHNPQEIVPDDFKALRAWSLEEVNGAPVLHMSVELHQHREYDPELVSLFLPSIDPRRLYPEAFPDKEAVADTEKQEVVQAPAESESAPPVTPGDTAPVADTSKSGKKATKSDASQDALPVGDAPKTDENAAKTGQGG